MKIFLIVVALLQSQWLRSANARRPTIISTRPTVPSSSCNTFFDGTFCAFAKTVKGPEQCNALASFSEQACPSQDVVCHKSFDLTTYCTENYGCTRACMRYLDNCCETQCCQESCLDDTLLCALLDVATCAEARMEICPCHGKSTENRTALDYCTHLVGGGRNGGTGNSGVRGNSNNDNSGGCIDQCVNFVSTCCNIQTGDVRLAEAVNVTGLDGDIYITGPLEVFSEGSFARICSSSLFDTPSAQVACRQLGYFAEGKYQYARKETKGGNCRPRNIKSHDSSKSRVQAPAIVHPMRTRRN